MNVGEVWYIDFPFEDDPNQSKKRPCIVIDVDTLEVLSIKVTTREARDEYDIPIFKWRDANLLEPSYARVSKSMMIPKSSFEERWGMIAKTDFKNIEKAFIKYNTQD